MERGAMETGAAGLGRQVDRAEDLARRGDREQAWSVLSGLQQMRTSHPLEAARVQMLHATLLELEGRDHEALAVFRALLTHTDLTASYLGMVQLRLARCLELSEPAESLRQVRAAHQRLREAGQADAEGRVLAQLADFALFADRLDIAALAAHQADLWSDGLRTCTQATLRAALEELQEHDRDALVLPRASRISSDPLVQRLLRSIGEGTSIGVGYSDPNAVDKVIEALGEVRQTPRMLQSKRSASLQEFTLRPGSEPVRPGDTRARPFLQPRPLPAASRRARLYTRIAVGVACFSSGFAFTVAMFGSLALLLGS